MAALRKKGDCQAALLEALKARVDRYMTTRSENYEKEHIDRS